LKNDIGGNDTFEAEIIGSIIDVQALIKRDEALKTNGGIFDTPKKVVKKKLNDPNSYTMREYELEESMFGDVDQEDFF
jgi:hypothetical protein